MRTFGSPKLLRSPLTSAEKRLLEIYPNLAAPAVNYKGYGYVTQHRTITPERAIAYWRDPDSIIATRPKSGMTHDIRIDLDKGGRYWDLAAIDHLRELLEDVGLVGTFLCRSSESDGRWLIVPLPEPMASWQASLTMASLLTDKNFILESGHLEVSPNVRKWTCPGKEAVKGIKADWIVDHNAFRLPCQNGFEILDFDGNTIGLSLEDYLHHWDWAQAQQCSEEWQATVDYYAEKENRPKLFKPRSKGTLGEIEQEHQDLCARGFTDASQTNDIGLNLARRLRILEPGDVEQQAALIKAAFMAMPGYREHCHHQHEIERRCGDLARWANKKWEHYGDRPHQAAEKPQSNQNLVRHTQTLNRLTRVLTDWIDNGFTFLSQTKIFKALKRHCGVGKKTFYKYLKQLPEFTAFVKKLLQTQKTETHIEQGVQHWFTPCSTKRLDGLGFLSQTNSQNSQLKKKKRNSFFSQRIGVSDNSNGQLSNTPETPETSFLNLLHNHSP